ncbi:hypothetical protein ISU07_07965 [Nocardioides islandensis]|uniref:Uncharacterized protein n=1 Tax=Nocardioides islandensis TaxID=433663 RepID=A0A930YCD6_9ACTN|nr:hypothetical protein [Nocardioides islandensis]MBF4763061.1 hypothetical protein [Nocardioides islandensis]
MTERLSALLHQEADSLDVPTPLVGDVLTAGRRVRRRRRLTQGVAVVAVLAVAGGTALLVGGGSDSPDALVADPAPTGTADVGAVFSVGNTVYLHGGTTSATLPEVVQAMYPTSAGVVLRTNKDGSSDGGAPFHFELVRPDGTVQDLGLTLGEVVPATDPNEPYLAYAAARGDSSQVVVVDVTSGDEVARVDVPDEFSWGGWEAPPVGLAGDVVYVGMDKKAVTVNWRTGESSTSDVVPGGGIPIVSGGHVVVQHGESKPVSVVDATTGATLLDVRAGAYPYVTLSPDGRFAKVVDQEKEQGFELYTVETGASVPIHGAPWEFGWTSDGELFSVSSQGVDVCSPTTGECSGSPLPAGVSVDGDLRVMGLMYES